MQPLGNILLVYLLAQPVPGDRCQSCVTPRPVEPTVTEGNTSLPSARPAVQTSHGDRESIKPADEVKREFAIARRLYENGHRSAALGILMRIEQKSACSHRVLRLARFFRGRILLESGFPEEARESLLQAREGLAAQDYVNYLLALASLQSDNALQALNALDRMNSRPAMLIWHKSHVVRADALRALGKTQQAIEAYARLLRRYPHYPLAAELRLKLAKLQLQRGNKGGAVRQLVHLMRRYPICRASHQAYQTLSELQPTRLTLRDSLLRAKVLVLLQMHDEAEDVFQNGLLATGDLSVGFQATRWFARLERDRGNFVSAWLLQDRLNQMKPGAATRNERFLWGLNGRFRSKKSRQVRPLKNASRKLARTYDRAELWRLSWRLYRAGQFADAAYGFEKLAGTWKRSAARGLYWAARSSQRLGNRQKAVALFGDVSSRFGTEYYGIQAQNRLMELGVWPFHMAALATVDAIHAEAAIVHWGSARRPSETTAVPDEKAVEAMGGLVANYSHLFPQIAIAHDLAIVGMAREAQDEIRTVAFEYARIRTAALRGIALRDVATRPVTPFYDNRRQGRSGWWGSALHRRQLDPPERARRVRRYRRILALGERFAEVLGQLCHAVGDGYCVRKYGFTRAKRHGRGPEEAPDDWALMYPLSFRREVDEAAGRTGIAPYLIWGLMTYESLHHPYAVSRSNARGLLQLLPNTAYQVAWQLPMPDFLAEQLFEPRINLLLGCQYLRGILDRFHNQEALAIAAYNTGPNRVSRWLDQMGHLELDEFVEAMPRKGPRLYVIRVLQNAAMYRRIYSKVRHLYVSQKIRWRP